MVLGIDASSAAKPTRTGVEWYAYHLIQAFKTRPLAEGERVRLYAPAPLSGPLGELPPGWETAVLPWQMPGWMRLRVGREMLQRPPDVLFVPSQGLPAFPPRRKGRATVTTIHDVGFRTAPALYEAGARRRIAAATRRSIRLATHLLTVSEFSKREIVRAYHVPEERITVTPLAADPAFRPYDAAAHAAAQAKYRLGTQYFLCVGRVETRKNQLTLLSAFEQFKARRGFGDPFELVLAGPMGWGGDAVRRYAEASSCRDAVRFIPYLPPEDYAPLLSGATAFTFPSRYEGFGIPLVEAMAAGTPLVASDIPPHREVAGDAALFVPPQETDAWIDVLARVARDASLRGELRARGLERAQAFSWERTADRTWEALHAGA